MRSVVAIPCILLVLSVALSPSTAFAPLKSIHQKSRRRQSTTTTLAASKNKNSDIEPPLYKLLATSDESKPGRSDFFYNDEVVSHLHGYMLLVGVFGALDEYFLISFLVLASTAAAATYAGALPANPRVPALVAGATLALTYLCRYGLLVYEPQFEGSFDKAPYFEVLVCALNIAWGVWGTWRTKEKKNGATFGF